jgi:uncharacterized protein HemY
MSVAADVTTGPQLMEGAAGFLLFCALGVALSKYIAIPRQKSLLGIETGQRVAKVSYWAWTLVIIIAIVVFLVGFVAWLTGTSFPNT